LSVATGTNSRPPAKNPNELAGFYRRLVGLEVTMADSVPGLGDFVFLNESAQAELPLIALHTNPQGRHIALQVESLEALRTFCADAKARGITASLASNPVRGSYVRGRAGFRA
jgi:hypothetical protein